MVRDMSGEMMMFLMDMPVKNHSILEAHQQINRLLAQAVSKRKNTPNRSSKPDWRLAKASKVDCREQIIELNQNRYFDMCFFRIDY